MRIARSVIAACAAATVAVAAAGCTLMEDTAGPGQAGTAEVFSSPVAVATPEGQEPAPGGEPVAGSAAEVLEALPVKGRAPKTGYDRDQYGQTWADIDRNGCDQRNDVLARDLTEVTFKPGTRDCVVATGVLADPFTATEIAFTRGQDTSSAVQIDHVVSLSNSWQTGAQQLSERERTELANDPLNLLAVDGPTNAQKGDGDAATWLPSNKAYRCDYVARQIAVKAGYELWVTAAEKDAMGRVLSTCPGHGLPTEQEALNGQEIATSSTRSPAPEASPADPTEVSGPFENCAAAREAGAAPVHSDSPGYAPHLDGNGDGIGCE